MREYFNSGLNLYHDINFMVNGRLFVPVYYIHL
jgi:hypothetical protein